MKTAMVVDNDFFFVEFLCELLEKRGYRVIKAYNGKEGIAKLDLLGLGPSATSCRPSHFSITASECSSSSSDL